MFSMKKALLLVATTLSSIQTTFAYENFDKCLKPGDFALTFDDGPHGTFTPKILDVLKKENVKATFFVNGDNWMGDIKENLEAQAIIKREIDEGHLVASHTYTHPQEGITSLSPEALTKEVKDLNDLLFQLYGIKPAFFRPPLGIYSEENRVVLEGQGFTANVIWNLDSNDWRYEDVIQNYKNALNEASPTTHSFISLNHDVNNVTAEFNVANIIPLVRERGYRFVTLDECLGMTAYQNVNSLQGKGNSTLPTAPTTTNPVLMTSPTAQVDPSFNLKNGSSSIKSFSVASAIALVSITLLNLL